MKERSPRKLDAGALWEYALRALSVRAHSAGDLRQKLLRRAENPADVPPALERLKEYGFLDDRRYAESFSASRLENRGFGRARVVRDLRKRRVAPGVAEKAVEAAYAGTEETALIEAYLRRKFRGPALEETLADPRKLAAAYRRLRTAGFTAGASIRTLKRFAADPELLDSLEEAGDEPALPE